MLHLTIENGGMQDTGLDAGMLFVTMFAFSFSLKMFENYIILILLMHVPCILCSIQFVLNIRLSCNVQNFSFNTPYLCSHHEISVPKLGLF